MTSALLVVWVLTAAPKPGTYVRSGGDGTLVLGKGHFKIDTVGGNAHTCELEGEWKGETGTVQDQSLPCAVKFEPGSEGLQVSAVDAGACLAYCGVRARFEGRYLTVPRGCASADVARARSRFKAQYGQKRWVDAAAILSAVLDTCEPVIDHFTVWWMRNDLALAQHHVGDDEACLRTLQPMSRLRDAAEDEVGMGEPAFAEELQKLARATRTNSKLCGHAPR